MVRASTLWNLLACVAGPPLLDTGQLNIITYLFIFLLPIIIISLMCSIFPDNPKALRFLIATILRGTPWPIRGHRGPNWRRRRKVKMKVKNQNPETTTTTRHCLRAHLFPLTMASLKVGCQVKSSLRCLRQSHIFHLHTPLAGINEDLSSGHDHFDSDSFPIRIDNHASYCMANPPHLFYDLILSDVYKINEIHEGLAILGKGTFRFGISNEDGRVHPIRIPNSPYLPKLQGVQFALNGKIPKKLALIKLPKCTGCLFGAMTKIPWQGKESKSSHKVFAATKLGETVSDDQMVSTLDGRRVHT
jgi:hypothetical protein